LYDTIQIRSIEYRSVFLVYPQAYINYLVHFHTDRDYFECHEILEDYWKITKQSKEERVWVALIQIAVAMYHHRRENWNGAERMIEKALMLIRDEHEAIKKLGLDVDELCVLLAKRLNEVKNRIAYTSMNLPILDRSLLHTCQEVCNSLGLAWGKSSNLSDEFLVNKHRLRDRTEVIAERINQLQRKTKMKKG